MAVRKIPPDLHPTDPRVVVAGDGCVDRFELAVAPGRDGPLDRDLLIWQTSPRLRVTQLPGDALLTAYFTRLATGGTATGGIDSAAAPLVGALQAHFTLGPFARSATVGDDAIAYRIREYRGFAGGDTPFSNAAGTARDAGLVVLDDAGNGFRYTPQAWPAALHDARALVLCKMGRPLGQGALWDSLPASRADRSVILLNAEDLRREGVSVSRRLSWERTAADLVQQLSRDARLATFQRCAWLIVRFGVDGAILRAGSDTTLFFEPPVAEDQSTELHPGRVRGLGSAFAAALAAHLLSHGLSEPHTAVRDALLAARRLLIHGYGDDADHVALPGPELFRPRAGDGVFVHARMPASADPDRWSIAGTLSEADVRGAAYAFVESGRSTVLDHLPAGVFGRLRTVDRAEIESYRAIQNLLREYVAGPRTGRPISIAVFGPPGSGKSFGVTEVAGMMSSATLETLSFDVTQLESARELAGAFHRVRDATLRGRLPFVFFDEFDADFNGPLGWLKYFLAPMQAGRFRDRDGLHPLGSAVFLFAGGTARTYAEFCRDGDDAALRAFRGAKGPDFVSRLRGHVDVKGVDAEGERDYLYLLRRALLIRAQLRQKAGHLFDAEGRCQIDPGVLRALLEVPAYRHGARSISAIIDMSMLAGRKRFERASLPSAAQLAAHVDAEEFRRLLTPEAPE